MNQRAAIKKFLHCLNEKKYSEADKYLQVLVNEKLKRKVAHAIKTVKLF